MTDFIAILGLSAGVIAVSMLALWALSLAIRDASIVDIFWGAGFMILAWVSLAASPHDTARGLAVAVLTSLWGGRLAGYLGWRNWGEPEDRRYQRMRAHHGSRFPIVSLYSVYGLQGVIMLVVSLPVLWATSQDSPDAPVLLDFVGLALFLVGAYFEWVGDAQLMRFRSNPANQGRVLDTGVWAWTRHPNYFGDCVVWWGLWVFALATPGGGFTIIGPIVMTIFLLRVSGVSLLERSLAKTKPDYGDYVARVPAFVPRPPRR